MYIFFNVNIIIISFFRLICTLYVQIDTQHLYIMCIEYFISVLNTNSREKVSVNIVVDVETELIYF